MSRILTMERVDKIAARQFPIRYGVDYIPSILATREEAPTKSRPAIRFSQRLGRDVHALSVSELKALALALHHPRVFDLQENFALNHGPGIHPLAGHPLGCALQLPATQGTLAHAAGLGVLPRHPRVRVAEEVATTDLQGSSSAWAPGFYIGDLLVYISDQQGPYLLDWDIKQHVGDHGQPGPGNLAKRHSKAAQLRAAARAAVIHAYDAELGIRQVPLAGEEIDGDVAANLFQLLGWHHHEVHHSRSERAELEDTMSASMRNGVSPISLLPTWTRRGWIRQDFLAVVYQAIWSRRIRVDLFRPVLIDRPLKAEIRDVFEVYDQWFRR